MKVAILTTGGTFDKVYFDANSEYSIGDPCITAILDEGNVNSDYRIQSILKKDSLDITSKERQIIKNSVQECVEERIIIIHGTDTMVETAKSLEDIKRILRELGIDSHVEVIEEEEKIQDNHPIEEESNE